MTEPIVPLVPRPPAHDLSDRPTRPLVSVIVATYEQAAMVATAVDSVLAQTYDDYEVLLLDNGSSDGTQEVLRAYGEDPRVRLFLFEQNEPLTRRMNAAVAECRGSLVSILYGDDYYLPDKLRLQVAALLEHDDTYGVVYGPGYRTNLLTGETWTAGGVDVSGDILAPLLHGSQRGRFINPISPLVRRRCFDRHPFHEDLFFEGEAQYLRIALTERFAYLPEPLVVMTDHEHNTGKATRRNGELSEAVLRKLGDHPDFPAALRPELDEALTTLFVRLAWQGVRVLEDRRWARRSAWRAVAVSPTAAARPKLLAAVALSLLPARVLSAVNALAYRVRPSREVVASSDG